jgi:hypothetical protein
MQPVVPQPVVTQPVAPIPVKVHPTGINPPKVEQGSVNDDSQLGNKAEGEGNLSKDSEKGPGNIWDFEK